MNIFNQLLELLQDEWEEELVIQRNEYLVRKHEITTHIYWVESGSLRVYVEDQEEEHTIRFGYKNSLLTALDSFLTGKPTSFYIQALKKSRLKILSKEKFQDIMQATEANRELWNTVLEGFVYQQLERELDLITYTPQKRFERLLQRSPQVFQEIPQKYIASYLRMTPETLSRILKGGNTI